MLNPPTPPSNSLVVSLWVHVEPQAKPYFLLYKFLLNSLYTKLFNNFVYKISCLAPHVYSCSLSTESISFQSYGTSIIFLCELQKCP